MTPTPTPTRTAATPDDPYTRKLSPIGWVTWRFLHALCYIWFRLCYRWRSHGTENLPATGGVLYVSNHQSFLDPIIVGLALYKRPFHALARSTLFKGPLGWLIKNVLMAIPVERNSADTAAMRRCLTVLQEGRPLLLFPEGTRTIDGSTGSFSPGLMLLIKRAKPTVIPVAIEGAFDAWPKEQKRPNLTGSIHVRFGAPLSAVELTEMGTEKALETMRSRIEEMRFTLVKNIRG